MHALFVILRLKIAVCKLLQTKFGGSLREDRITIYTRKRARSLYIIIRVCTRYAKKFKYPFLALFSKMA